jgi:Gas vesicle protein
VAPVQLRSSRSNQRARCPGMTSTLAERDVALVDLVDRLLGGGVVIAGDITLSVAEVDLVYVSLRALVTSVATAEEKELLPRMGDAF